MINYQVKLVAICVAIEMIWLIACVLLRDYQHAFYALIALAVGFAGLYEVTHDHGR